ncbi:secreted protein, partial [Candidatus Thiomargarita nelsonii]
MVNFMMETRVRDLSRWIVGTSLLVGFSSASQAVLQDYAQNDVQSDIAEAIPIVCRELSPNGSLGTENGGFNNPDLNQRDLFSACN